MIWIIECATHARYYGKMVAVSVILRMSEDDDDNNNNNNNKLILYV